MKFISEETFEEILADGNLTNLIKFCTKQCAKHGQDFERLWEDGETEKIKQCLQPGQWEKFTDLWAAKSKLMQRNQRPTPRQLEQELLEFKSARNDPVIMEAAEALRQSEHCEVRAFNPDWLNADQVILIGKAKAALEPSMPDITKGKRFTGNKRGLSALYREALTILKKHGKEISAKVLWDLLKSDGSEKVIHEVTGDDVYWRDDNGHDKTTKRTTLTSRLSEIRKKVI